MKQINKFNDNQAPVKPINFHEDSRASLLSQADVGKINSGVLSILQDVGIKFPLPMALDIFEKAGAEVNRDTQLVKISSDLLQWDQEDHFLPAHTP